MPRKHGGKDTGKETKYGKPIYEKDGDLQSERSITYKIDDKYVNVPSIHGQYEYGEDELYDAVVSGKIKPTSAHGSVVEARKAAKQRSNEMFKGKPRGRPAGQSSEKAGQTKKRPQRT